jgi:sugar O-acyltransferase (sialic acid O-acetyltransferase NeuD family)
VKILVYGSATFGGVVRVLVEECGHEFAGFIDDVNGRPDVLGGFDAVKSKYAPAGYAVANAVGYKDLAARRRVTDRILAAGYLMPALVHPKAIVGRDSRVGDGAMVMAGAILDCRVELKSCAVLWPGVVVAHDSVIGANTFLSPNCTICGCCEVGEDCFVGAGSVVVDHTNVPVATRIKAAERYVTAGTRSPRR